MEILFWILLGIVFYTYIGYGILLCLIVFIKESFRGRRVLKNIDGEPLPTLTLIVAAFNEQDIVRVKMANCYSLRYPKDRLTIMWATDGSNDSTNEILSEYGDVVVSFSPLREGKTKAITNAMKVVSSELVVFTDANTMLNEDALLNIQEMFLDPKVGCVAGEKRVKSEADDVAVSSGEGAYWRYESKLKELDYRLHSAVGAAGELYAIRSFLYEPVSRDTLLDDFIISLNIVRRGYIIAYCRDAYALESGSADMLNEKKRKVRIAAGGLQSIWRLRSLLNVFKYGVFSFQYFSHRVLRWTIAPVALFALLIVNVAMVVMGESGFYLFFLVAQLAFYSVALIGYILRDNKIKHKVIFVPMFFVFMNLNVFYGIPYLIKNRGKGTWERVKRMKE